MAGEGAAAKKALGALGKKFGKEGRVKRAGVRARGRYDREQAEEQRFSERQEGLEKRVSRWDLEEKEREYKQKRASRHRKRITFYIVIGLIVVGLIWGLYLLFFTQMGSQGLVGLTGAKAGIFNMFQSSESEVNIGVQILKGNYDPSTLWSSQTYQDQYASQATQRGPGIYITRLEPLRDLFPTESQMIIFGQMEAESIPGEDLSIRITAESDASSGAVNVTGWGDLGSSGLYWECEPASIENQRVYTGRFQCYSSYGLSGVEAGFSKAEQVTVSIDYDFNSVAGKQIYVANSAELDALWASNQNPLVYYGVSSDATSPWKTAGPVDVSIGIAGLSEDIIPANDDRNTIASYLIVRVLNRGDGAAKLLSNISIQVPQNVHGITGSDSNFNKLVCEEGICTYVADTAGTEIEAGLVEAYYFKFKVCDGARTECEGNDFLSGAPVSSFFILSDLKYNYKTSMATTVTAKNLAKAVA